MTLNEYLTIDDFPKVEEIVKHAFSSGEMLPNDVFNRRFRFTLLADCERMMGPGLPKILHDRRFCDPEDTILMSVLEPDPVKGFYKYFGKINSILFKASISEDDYDDLRCLDPGVPTDAIQFTADTLVWIPDYGRWAIWGERRGREIAVIGFYDPAQADFLLNEDGYWIDAETAIREDFARAPYRDQKAPEDFARALIENYGSKQDLERKLREAGVAFDASGR